MDTNGPHPSEGELVQYLVGPLGEEQRAALEAHVKDCSSCQDRLDELSALPPHLRQALTEARMQPPGLPGYVYERDANGWPVELGHGGLGVVYLARREDDARPVAVKFISGGVEAYTRFAREVGASLESNHEGIVKAYEFGTASDGRLYYVMEYVEGANLHQFQDGRPFPPQDPGSWAKEVARWALWLTGAIQHAHANGFLHRDLKPGNVLVGLAGGRPHVLKVTDFGLARRLNTPRLVTRTGQWVGTPVYSPPEQIEASGAVTAAADVYGVGAVLYFMRTGQAPFDQDLSYSGLLDAVKNKDPEPPGRRNPAVPSPLETICLKCLRKEPGDRYESAGELAADLTRFLNGKRPRAKRRTQLERVARWGRRNPKTVAVLLTVLGLLGLSTVLFVRERARKEEADRHRQDAEVSAAAAGRHEAQAHALALARLLDAARSALGRGQLRVAEPLFDQAVAATAPGERPALEVERLRCLVAFGRWDRLQAELGRLARRDDLPGSLRAEVLLHRGDVGLWEVAPDKQAAAREAVRAALALPDGLRAADAAYARGLLDDSSYDAVGHFEDALAHDKFHHRANAALLMELVLTGQFERARRRADFVAAVFPDEPVTPLARALIATLQEDASRRNRHLAELRRLVADSARMAGLEHIFSGLDQVIRVNHRLHGPKRGPAWLASLLSREGVGRMFAPQDIPRLMRQEVTPFALEGVPGVVGVGLPVLGRPVRMCEEMGLAYKRLGNHDYAGAAAMLEAAGRKYPESLVRLLHAVALLSQAEALQRQGDLAGCLRQSAWAHALAEEAADAPTLLPFGPYRHNAHWLCLLVEVGWQAQHRWDAAVTSTAALGCAAPSFGANPYAAAAILTAGGIRLQTYPAPKDRRHLMHLTAARRGYDEARSDMLPPLLGYFVPDDARLLLAAWAGDAPQDLTPARLRAELELREGNLAEALRWTERGLAISPRNNQLRQLRDRVKAMLESARKKVVPPRPLPGPSSRGTATPERRTPRPY